MPPKPRLAPAPGRAAPAPPADPAMAAALAALPDGEIALQGQWDADPAPARGAALRGPVIALLHAPRRGTVIGVALGRRLVRPGPGEPAGAFQGLTELPPGAARDLGADRAWLVAVAGAGTYEVTLGVMLQVPGGEAPVHLARTWLQRGA